MFIHVPKTAGTSIINFLKSNFRHQDLPVRFDRFRGHDPYYELKMMNDSSQFFKFSVVRNPYTRAFSQYKSYIKLCSAHNVGRYLSNFTFNDFLSYIKNSNGLPFYTQFTLNIASYALMDQCFFIHDENGNITLEKIYRFENLSEFEENFNTKLQNYNSSQTTLEEYLSNYTKENTQLVKHIYYRDFSIFNYSFHFEDSIN